MLFKLKQLSIKERSVASEALALKINGNNANSVNVGDVIVRVNPRYFRPAEVETLLGDPSKAKKLFGWTPEITVEQMCAEMMDNDLDIAKRQALLTSHGYNTAVVKES